MKKLLLIGGALALIALIASTQVCLGAGFRYGLWMKQCPDGQLRQVVTVNAPGFTRGAPSLVSVGVEALSTFGPADVQQSTPVTSFDVAFTLVGSGGSETALATDKNGFSRVGDQRQANLEVPKVDDGDYLLRAKVKSRVGETTVDLPVALYAPARVHLLTDRPLYEAGNRVKFRAVALRARDLTPLDSRPGVFIVRDPNGEVLLEEKAAAGPWGVVTGSFPLDGQAESGNWSVEWRSGAASGTRTFEVRPFTLPRFRVEASAAKSFYRRGERPVLKGDVRYSSGAPVQNAKLELNWSVSGDWPPPTSWSDGSGLPKTVSSNAQGRFTVELPSVPDDLQGQASLRAQLSVTDESGDRITGAAEVLLSQDPIAVDAVTELEGGLVQGFNNRLFLRATTADGRVLEGAQLLVKRLWEPTDKGVGAQADEDGVASLQIDPGPPVNVIIPALPFRPPPAAQAVQRGSLDEMLQEDGEVTLADRLAFDRFESKLQGCTRYADRNNGYSSVQAGVRVSASGKVTATSVPSHRLGRCVGKQLESLTLNAGRDRLFTASWQFDDSDLPLLTASPNAVPMVPTGLEEALADAMLDVRDCLPRTVSSGTLPRTITWSLPHGKREAQVTWVTSKSEDRFAESALSCIQSRIKTLTLPKQVPGEEEEVEGAETASATIGIATLSVEAPEKYEAERPQETVLVGYEFLVTAKVGNELIGTTKLRLQPGTVPSLRVRATPQIAKPGDSIEVELLRGPSYTGELPEKAYLRRPGEKDLEAKLDEKTRRTSFTLPERAEGWAEVNIGDAHTFLFIQPSARLSVALKPDQARYSPGQLARLEVETTVGSSPGPAAVGLFGVDESLGQLVALPGGDEMNSLRPRVESTGAFGSLDAQALSMGRVRGANAAAATLVRVTATPPAVELETSVAVSGHTLFDPIEPLTDHFYVVLSELHVQTREWESSSPAAERMTPRVMASLWGKSLDAVQKRDGAEMTHDGWGRRLKLHRLPADLLSLTDPRAVVVDGTRLPEDVENWSQWVAKERP